MDLWCPGVAGGLARGLPADPLIVMAWSAVCSRCEQSTHRGWHTATSGRTTFWLEEMMIR